MLTAFPDPVGQLCLAWFTSAYVGLRWPTGIGTVCRHQVCLAVPKGESGSDVLAWLGLEAPALAWLGRALASWSSSHSLSRRGGLGLAWLWLKPGLEPYFVTTESMLPKAEP